jgi:hypothetical protein
MTFGTPVTVVLASSLGIGVPSGKPSMMIISAGNVAIVMCPAGSTPMIYIVNYTGTTVNNINVPTNNSVLTSIPVRSLTNDHIAGPVACYTNNTKGVFLYKQDTVTVVVQSFKITESVAPYTIELTENKSFTVNLRDINQSVAAETNGRFFLARSATTYSTCVHQGDAVTLGQVQTYKSAGVTITGVEPYAGQIASQSSGTMFISGRNGYLGESLSMSAIRGDVVSGTVSGFITKNNYVGVAQTTSTSGPTETAINNVLFNGAVVSANLTGTLTSLVPDNLYYYNLSTGALQPLIAQAGYSGTVGSTSAYAGLAVSTTQLITPFGSGGISASTSSANNNVLSFKYYSTTSGTITAGDILQLVYDSTDYTDVRVSKRGNAVSGNYVTTGLYIGVAQQTGPSDVNLSTIYTVSLRGVTTNVTQGSAPLASLIGTKFIPGTLYYVTSGPASVYSISGTDLVGIASGPYTLQVFMN